MLHAVARTGGSARPALTFASRVPTPDTSAYAGSSDTLQRVFVIGALVFLVAEIAAFVAVGERIGFGWAVLLLIGISALGPFIVRRVGLGVLGRAQERLDRGDLPTRELLDGVVALGGGIIICVPGFISDALGLLLMVRPVRGLFILAAGRWLVRRVQKARAVRWKVVNTRSRPADQEPPVEIASPGRFDPGGPANL